jgi:hypothetical protein
MQIVTLTNPEPAFLAENAPNQAGVFLMWLIDFGGVTLMSNFAIRETTILTTDVS